MISFSLLGQIGNLGNQLFQIASVAGIATRLNLPFVFPEWKYSKYFKHPIPTGAIKYDEQVTEPHYHYGKYIFDIGKNIDLKGYFQSEKHWIHCEELVKQFFTWNPEFKKSLRDKHKKLYTRETIAISVRRGDYVGNLNYHQLGLDYYLGALAKFFNPDEYNVLIFSDDIPYCKNHFPDYCFFMQGEAIEQLCLMSLCDHFIIANSSFSWWGAYLGEKAHSKVIAPAFWNAGELLRKADDKDVVPERWVKFNPRAYHLIDKIDLSDVTFTIPIKIDHTDRMDNLVLSIQFLINHFNTNIIIYEQDEKQNINPISLLFRSTSYKFIPYKHSFERTRLLNEMAKEAKTSIIANWDCDVFIDPQQILKAVNKLRNKECSGVYPYDGRFFRVHRGYFRQFWESLDINIFNLQSYRKFDWETESFGGAILWDKEQFIKGGMENENMIHYGPEDFERIHRFRKLGFKVDRVKGPLFHMDHFTGSNGSKGHEYLDSNFNEFEKIKAMSKGQLQAYVDSWPWNKTNVSDVKNTPAGESLLNFIGFDKVYCVNLEKRTERRQSAEAEFLKAGIKNVHFFPAVDGRALNLSHFDNNITPGMMGCFESHKAIIKEAIDKNFESILVFEDDLRFEEGFNLFLKKALPQIPDDWQFVYLGWTEYDGLHSFKERVSKNWVIPKSVWGTHAYMVRGKEAFKKLNEMLTTMETQIDMQLARWLPTSGLKYYSLWPCMISQKYEELGTDVQERVKEVKL